MKNQKGFTLVELMVVMAIIAILATAGISQYGRFIKTARDTTRIADLQAINVVLLDAIQSSGIVPETDKIGEKIVEVIGKKIEDKVTGTGCLDADKKPILCGYQYAQCDGGTGYILATSFEGANNIEKYKKDDRGGSADKYDDLYEIGSCESIEGTLSVIKY